MIGCATSPRATMDTNQRVPASGAALLAALSDTATARRVYLPREVAVEARTFEDTSSMRGALATASEPTVRIFGIRGIVDTLGFAERATLTVLPGSDPREAANLMARVLKARWRPARLATGQAVRQVFDWRECRTSAGSCGRVAMLPPDRIERDLPHVDQR
jgi:hypothetical protein